MIHVRKKILDRNFRDLKLFKGDECYMLDFRSGPLYSKEYPNRASLTRDPWMKKLYTLDDAINLFDATNLGNFKAEQNRIVDNIIEVVLEIETERDKFPDATPPWLVYEKRVEILKEWVERIMVIKAKWPLEKQIKKIRQQHTKLR